MAINPADWTDLVLFWLSKVSFSTSKLAVAFATQTRTCAAERAALFFYTLPLYFRPHAISPPPSNFLQFTADQNLLIKKDIFGAAHFPMMCQPFWASCHLSSQHCGWDLIPGKLCEPNASELGRASGKVGFGCETQMKLALLETRSLNRWACCHC